MADFHTQLRRLRKQRGMTQEELAKQLGVRKSTISNYENHYSTPPFATLERLAQLMNTSIDTLAGTSLPVQEDSADASGQADVLIYPAGSKSPSESFVSMPRSILGEGDFFMVQLPDDALEFSSLKKDDYVLCRQQNSVADGELAVVLIRGKTQSVRYFSRTGAKVALVSSGKTPPVIYNKNDVTVLGKVVKALSAFSD